MKRLVCQVLLLLLLGAALAEPAHEVVYFYESYCESCSPEEDFAADFRALTGLSLDKCAFAAHNVVTQSGRHALDDAVKQYALEEPSLPMAIVDGTVYAGSRALSDELPRTALSWIDTTDSVVLYLYVPACESCARAAAVLDSLPESVEVRRGGVQFTSQVRVEKIDASAQTALANALFEAYEVPDGRRATPCAFLSDRCLSGIDEIERDLPVLVTIGRAAGGVLDVQPAGTPGAVNGLTTLAAGWVAGLNPCALSMLLLFLSAMLKAGRRGGLLCACFLAAKFACYLLIGFLFLGLLQRCNPTWLRPLARGLLTALGAVLIALNLWDAWQIRRQRFGRVRNQLPTALRGGLHRAIRALTSGRVLIPAVVALGVVVALGEFLCAGQLYLIQLLSALQAGQRAQAMQLVLYCLAFITPSALICVLVLKGGSQARVSAFFADHMAAVKLLTALMMLAMTVVAWSL